MLSIKAKSLKEWLLEIPDEADLYRLVEEDGLVELHAMFRGKKVGYFCLASGANQIYHPFN